MNQRSVLCGLQWQARARCFRIALCVPAYRCILRKAASFALSTDSEKGHAMKIKLATACFVIGTVLAPVAAHAADGDSDRMHPMAFVKDSVVTTKVKAKLAEDKMSSLAHIKVDTDAKGSVVLGGNVKTREEADKAVSIAHARSEERR